MDSMNALSAVFRLIEDRNRLDAWKVRSDVTPASANTNATHGGSVDVVETRQLSGWSFRLQDFDDLLFSQLAIVKATLGHDQTTSVCVTIQPMRLISRCFSLA